MTMCTICFFRLKDIKVQFYSNNPFSFLRATIKTSRVDTTEYAIVRHSGLETVDHNFTKLIIFNSKH